MTEALLSNKALGTQLQDPGGTVCVYIYAHDWQFLDHYEEKKEKKIFDH